MDDGDAADDSPPLDQTGDNAADPQQGTNPVQQPIANAATANNAANQPANQAANQVTNQPANQVAIQPVNNAANQAAANQAAANQQQQGLANIFNNLGVNFQSLVASTLRSYPRRLPVNNHGPVSYRRHRYPFPSSTDLANWALASSIKRELILLAESVKMLRSIIASSQDPENPSQQAFASLKQSYQSISQLQKLLDVILENVPIEARPTPRSAVAAQKVFDIAELMEKILLNCDYHELLPAINVNKTFVQAFQGSPRIQQKMGLKPVSSDQAPFSPLANSFFISRGCIVRLEDHHRYGHQVLQNELVLSAIFNGSSPFEEQPLPRISQRFRDTLVCQPPLKQMRVRAGCCEDPLFRRRAAVHHQHINAGMASVTERDEEMNQLHSIESETGITLGHILDETRKLREQHRYCPDAYPSLHRDDGTVDVHVHFEAILSLPGDDPTLVANRKNKDSFDVEQNEYVNRDRKIQAYVAAKQNARDNALPIPTLQEFEAQHAVANVEEEGEASTSPYPLP